MISLGSESEIVDKIGAQSRKMKMGKCLLYERAVRMHGSVHWDE